MCAEQSDILNAEQAADYLGIPLYTLREKCQRRELPHFRMSDKPNGHLRFRKTDLDEWIEDRIVPATGPLPVSPRAVPPRRRGTR